jgi:hypothetical protein
MPLLFSLSVDARYCHFFAIFSLSFIIFAHFRYFFDTPFQSAYYISPPLTFSSPLIRRRLLFTPII